MRVSLPSILVCLAAVVGTVSAAPRPPSSPSSCSSKSTTSTTTTTSCKRTTTSPTTTTTTSRCTTTTSTSPTTATTTSRCTTTPHTTTTWHTSTTSSRSISTTSHGSTTPHTSPTTSLSSSTSHRSTTPSSLSTTSHTSTTSSSRTATSSTTTSHTTTTSHSSSISYTTSSSPTSTTSSKNSTATSTTTSHSSSTTTSLKATSASSSSTITSRSSTTTSRSSTSSSSSSTTSSASLGICSAVAAGAAIPAVPATVNLLSVGLSDAPFELSESQLLASISFPNGLKCRKNLVILFPGTAVPAADTFTSTFIPVFADASTAEADVMLVSNPSFSLGDAQITAEYAAFAINYAALVLGRKATIIPWSQGNLNTQWALKYWPSTRINLKNYVGMSPDYDGTVEASFLCDPSKLLTQNLGTLITDFTADNGLATNLEALLGLGSLPTTTTDFKLYLLGLLSGDATALKSGTVSVSAGITIPTLSIKGRAVPFGEPPSAEMKLEIEQAIRKRATTIAARQDTGAGGVNSALVQLIDGLVGPVAEALNSLLSNPESVLGEVLTNYGGNLGNLEIPSIIPQGCLPAIWQQVYFSNFVNTLATDYGKGAGDTAFVPTTTVFSLTDEIVEPQGATGFESASGYLKGSLASNIYIQGNGGCSVIGTTLTDGLPSTVTHEGVLYSGMGVGAAVAAVNNGGMVTVDMIDASARCELVSPLLTAADALAQEATIPGALARILLGGGTEALAGGFMASEPAIKSYATIRH